ncbi:hypothetical protein CDAR_45191 [Caerostris darwini]|uniref:Uncharacterized protein n=1 Tax=Caerostris darwini TaxID=1538125 RepID=A0AAV4QAS4_9ARAC|nr:hypothetical protein CDAR_45191 [Caerostris darwini]
MGSFYFLSLFFSIPSLSLISKRNEGGGGGGRSISVWSTARRKAPVFLPFVHLKGNRRQFLTPWHRTQNVSKGIQPSVQQIEKKISENKNDKERTERKQLSSGIGGIVRLTQWRNFNIRCDPGEMAKSSDLQTSETVLEEYVTLDV